MFPYIFYLVLAGEEKLFAIFITISLVTDILDGWIARRFKLQTAIGARLDSWADLGTYILAFMAIYYFKWEEISPHALIFYLFAAAMALSYLAVIVKFGGLIGLHTYMFRIGGYLQGGFIIVLFLWGFKAWLFYFCLGWGILACIEQVIIILWLRQPRSNVKGLYWVLKNGNR